MTPETALDEIRALADPERAEGLLAYHKVPRTYLGVTNPQLNDLTKRWRQELDVPTRVTIARSLWDTDIFEARVAATKLLMQARLRPDDTDAWNLIVSWVPEFDSWAIADHAMMAGQKRLVADLSRIETVESWTTAQSHWTRRAAMVITLPFTKQNNPKPEETAIREKVLGWAATYVHDSEWFIQKSVGWWLRELSKHDAQAVRDFMKENGRVMKPFARKEAEKYLG